MKRSALSVLILIATCISLQAQNIDYYKDIVKDLSSARFQGRGYARNGVVKAGKYIRRQFVKSGADEVIMQPFTIDINTFGGKMKMSVDGRVLNPGDDFTLREFSPGGKGEYGLYFIDTLDYNPERIFADLAKPENKDVFVVCDFWFTYKHKDDFRKMEKREGAPNAGMIYTWNTPLKFYKAYGEKVGEKPVIWVSDSFPKKARSIKIDIENKFLENYESCNVIAKVMGERHDSCYMFTAHYDHLGNLGRRLYFPGTNDNASGTAAIITLAEYYKQHKPKFDMVFVAFAGEEANLRGSTYFINHPTVSLGTVKYLFNLDMIGDNNPVQYCEVSDPGMAGYAKMEAINDQNHYFKAFNLGKLAANSDHWPFAQQGVPCIMFENEEGETFPYYHTAHDDLAHAVFSTYEPIFKLVLDYIKND